MLSVEVSRHGDIKIGWDGRFLMLIEPSEYLVDVCQQPQAEYVLSLVAEEMADTTVPSIPAAFVERVLRRQGVTADAELDAPVVKIISRTSRTGWQHGRSRLR